LPETDYTILQRYQAVLRGLYNYYCMATNVGSPRRMGRILRILEVSLAKTLANKRKISVTEVFRRYRVEGLERRALRVIVKRPGKDALVATFGGFRFERVPDGMGMVDVHPELAWKKYANRRSEVVQRLAAGRCELCGVENVPVAVHHIRKLSD